MATISNFKPIGGKHCITTAIRQIFNYNGHVISEEMIFGVGSGLGFAYLNLSNAPMLTGRTKPFEFEERIARRFGIEIRCKQSKRYDVVFQKTKRFIDSNQPVLVYTDMPYLPYLNLAEDNHFGGHAVVLFGYDDEQECFYVSDRDNSDYPMRTPHGDISQDFHLVDYAAMERARSSSHRPFPVNNKYLAFDFTNYTPITAEMLAEAIHETCHNMLNPPANLLGISGIGKFAKEVLKWHTFDVEKRKRAGETNYFMISADGGTGGGMFRRMYGAFLVEASHILGDSVVKELGNSYDSVAQQWEQIASLLWDLSVSGDADTLKPISDMAGEICKREADILHQLSAI